LDPVVGIEHRRPQADRLLQSTTHCSLSDTPFAMSTTTTTTTTAAAQPMTAETILRLFPDIDTNDDALSGHDEEQIRLMDEMCIVTDDNDMPVGKASKKICT